MDILKIIMYNDDNHAEKIWINGNYIGDLSNIKNVFDNLIALITLAQNEIKTEYSSVWICDDFNNYEGTEDQIDEIADWFSTCKYMNAEQIEAIFNKNWDTLYNLIK